MAGFIENNKERPVNPKIGRLSIGERMGQQENQRASQDHEDSSGPKKEWPTGSIRGGRRPAIILIFPEGAV